MLSSETLAEIQRLVNFAIGKISKAWNLTDSEREDMAQDAIIAGIEAYRRYDSSRGRKLANWLLDRIIGQLKDSATALRSGGIVGGTPLILALDANRLGLRDPVPSDGVPGHTLSSSFPEAEDGDRSTEPIDNRPGPEERAEVQMAIDRLDAKLGLADKRILGLYYGLDGSAALTVSQLGARLGCSRKHAFNLLQIARKHAKEALLHA